jgi:hypothetical protein
MKLKKIEMKEIELLNCKIEKKKNNIIVNNIL